MAFYVDVIGCSVEKTQKEAGLYQLRAGSSLIDLLLVDERPDRIEGVVSFPVKWSPDMGPKETDPQSTSLIPREM